MGNLISTDNAYKEWTSDISLRFKQSQIKASMQVNSEMLRFYWSLGRDMDSIKDNYSWGSHFYDQISKDLKKVLPEVKSFSPRNLLYMHQFYRLFPQIEITPQHDALIAGSIIAPQADAQIEMPNVFCIPWGHQKL